MIRLLATDGRILRSYLASVATLTVATTQIGASIHTEAEPSKQPPESTGSDAFDRTKQWERALGKASAGHDFLHNLIFSKQEKAVEKEDAKPEETSPTNYSSFDEFMKAAMNKMKQEPPSTSETTKTIEPTTDYGEVARDFMTLITGGKDSKEKAIKDLISQASRSAGRGDISDHMSFSEMIPTIEQDLKALVASAKNTLGTIDLGALSTASMMYFVEHEDERKNPSWKRRMHRFHYGIDIHRITHLNDMLALANLSYADSIDDIVDGLQNASEPMELVYCELASQPGKPSHFIALKKDQSMWSQDLEVTMVVRGTKTLTDVITDCIADSVDYRGGKAHSGILDSGLYLTDKHKDLLINLRKLSKKRRIKLTLVGHSLGAGAAAIAGMEFNDMPQITAEVIGFGCPSLLNKELSESTKSYITTVVSDSDLVPRMSAATVKNALLDVMEYDWIPHARRDILFTFEELLRVSPGLLSQSSLDSIMTVVDRLLETYMRPTIQAPTTEREPVVLCPPGVCVHLYRDGSGVSGTIAPCTFFNEIDVTRRMVDDHLIPSGYQQVFLELMRQYYQDQYFRFDETKETR